MRRFAVLLLASLTLAACSKPAPPVGRWTGTFESQDMMVDATSGAIAQTILSLGRAMGISVIAEGVETEEQRGYLAALGCHSFQGYLFSRPLPLDKFEAFVQSFANNGSPG